MKIECRPLSSFPVPETRSRKASAFRITPGRALDHLERECQHLRAPHIIIEADFRESDIRLDGWPYANARPRSPRVVLTLPQSKYGPLRYPCDTYTTWEANVRAIALALEALRAVDRHGVTRRGEQYAGWKALTAGKASDMTAEAAATVLAGFSGVTEEQIAEDVGLARAALRVATKRTHPDVGGSDEAFHQVQTARKVLSTHHGVSL